MRRCAMDIFCCNCDRVVLAEKITGGAAYPHRRDLSHLFFWQCPACFNFVGTHRGKKARPLGVIATDEMKRMRVSIHKTIDPIWQTGAMARSQVYKKMAEYLDIDEYHTAELSSINECRDALIAAKTLSSEVMKKGKKSNAGTINTLRRW